MLYFRNLSVSDGLTSNMISSFAQDSQGFIWIGTQDGLVRFDGLSARKFLHDPVDSTSIASNYVAWDITEDDKRRIWVTLHGNGFTRYDPATDQFYNYTYANGRLPEEWCNHTQEILFGKDGSTLVFCNQGLIVLDSTDAVVSTTFLPEEAGLEDIAHVRMAAYHGRHIWLATLFGLAKYDPVDHTWEYHRQDANNSGVFKGTWRVHGAAYLEGTIWFSTYFKPENSEHRYLYSFNIDQNRLDSVPIAPAEYKKNAFSDQIRSIVKDEEGTLWLGSEGLGLRNYHPESRRWERHNGTDEWRGALLHGSINRLFIDRDKNLWIGLKTGVSIMAPKRQFFKNYAVVKDNSGNRVELTGISSLAVGPEDDVWLGKLGEGLIHLDAQKHFVKQFKTFYPSKSDYADYLDVRSADYEMVTANVWYDGVAQLNRSTGEVIRTQDFMPKDKPEIRNILRTRNGQLYGYGWGQFGKLSMDEGTFEGFTTPLNGSGNPDLVWTALEDDKGKIWLGMGQRGMLCVDPETLAIVDSWERDTSVYPMTGVWKMVHHEGKIYFSLASQGMGIYDVATGEVTSYSKKDGLCSDEVSGFVKDSENDIWVYSASGLSWFDQESGRFKTFNQADGMVSEKVNDAGLLTNGNILMITAGGLIEFNPVELKSFSPTYQPFVKSIRVYDEDLNVSDWLQEKSTITVPHDGNYLRVEFSALEFIDPKKVKFAYVLKGAEEEWNYSDHKPLAIYTNMSGGNYSLCAKCQNADGIWGEELCIPIFVTTPFYMKLWFILLMIAIAGAISFLVYRWQLRKKLAVLEVRNRLSKDLHDDIGSALSSINIYSSVAQQQIDQDTGEARKLLERMGNSARGMMQSMDDIIWAIDPGNDSVEKLVSRMRQFAAPVLEAKNIDFTFKVEQSVTDLKLDMIQRRNLFLVFKEAINNAAKYSNAESVNAIIAHSGSRLSVVIKDNGIGFDPDAKTDRHGITNMKERVQELKGEILIDSGSGKGTEIVFHIPVT